MERSTENASTRPVTSAILISGYVEYSANFMVMPISSPAAVSLSRVVADSATPTVLPSRSLSSVMPEDFFTSTPMWSV